MKVIELEVENLKRIRAVLIRPTSNLVEISGKNGAGKSSVLDALWWTIGGAGNIQASPIRTGEDQARIKADLGDIIVTRTFGRREGKKFVTSVRVESAEGARYPTPQDMLNKLVGKLTFDPLQFSRLDPKAQLETLRQFVPDVDFAAIDAENEKDFTRRTDVNRRAKAARAQQAAIPVPADAPPALIDEADLVAQLEEAGAANAERARQEARREAARKAVEEARARGNEALNHAKRLREEAKAQDAIVRAYAEKANELEESLKAAKPLPDPVDTSELRRVIAEARKTNEAVNRAIRAKAEHASIKKIADDLEAEAKALTDAMERRNAEKAAAIASAKMPVDGIAFGDDGIMLNGQPFEQASDAEQLRTSIAIAMAANPKLRVIRVRDGSLLDDDAMTILAEMAAASDHQVWIERVGAGGKVGFVLEDGMLKEGSADA